MDNEHGAADTAARAQPEPDIIAERAERYRKLKESQESQEKPERPRRTTRAESQSRTRRGPDETVRVGERQVTAEPPNAGLSSKANAEELASQIIQSLNGVAVMFTSEPAAAMNMFEQMMVQTPLQEYLSRPAVYKAVSEKMTPFMIVIGLSMWGVRLNSIRLTKKAAAAEERRRNALNTRGNIGPVQTEDTAEKPGKVDPSLFQNPSNDPEPMHGWFQRKRAAEEAAKQATENVPSADDLIAANLNNGAETDNLGQTKLKLTDDLYHG